MKRHTQTIKMTHKTYMNRQWNPHRAKHAIKVVHLIPVCTMKDIYNINQN